MVIPTTDTGNGQKVSLEEDVEGSSKLSNLDTGALPDLEELLAAKGKAKGGKKPAAKKKKTTPK
jgi:hypothetical protein